jgi:hypothetical protein
MQDAASLIECHSPHDEAVTEIVQIALRFPAEEALGVIELANGRFKIIEAISRRVALESREKDGL